MCLLMELNHILSELLVESLRGSVLGPILFCIYVNDVSDIIIGNTACKLCADDIKLCSCVETDGSSSDLDAS